ncbi:gp570 [Bacillus phage G]|uniref:Gp570 n=1 Tax=Bacillus phage G TaxID=2884420 RepID=G3MAV0_9CAUD|nr:gp570 [Bacillus phage G]AEO93816.1 gp570 [Bacillus phage G]
MFIGLITWIFFDCTLITLPLFLFGSILPDIDHPKSKLGRFNLLNRIKVRKKGYRGQSVRLIKHRGKSHTILGIILLSSPFLLINYQSFEAVFLGSLSHILGDRFQALFTKSKYKLRLW